MGCALGLYGDQFPAQTLDGEGFGRGFRRRWVTVMPQREPSAGKGPFLAQLTEVGRSSLISKRRQAGKPDLLSDVRLESLTYFLMSGWKA
jgi:hypothetical protein